MAPSTAWISTRATAAFAAAALHAGVIGNRGGPVSVVPQPGRTAYAGVTRNGVTSSNWGHYDSSFGFATGSATAAATAPPQDEPVAASAVCPDNLAAFAGTSTRRLACECSPEATANGSVYGMDIYTSDSSICRAALHAGVIGKPGGPVRMNRNQNVQG